MSEGFDSLIGVVRSKASPKAAIQFLFHFVAASLTITLGLAQTEGTSGASITSPKRPPSLQLLLPPPERAIVLPALGPEDLEKLSSAGEIATPVGVHRTLPNSAVARSFATDTGGWIETTAGPVWRLRIESTGASALRIHFRDVTLGKGQLWIHAGPDHAFGPYTTSGPFGDGEFWSPAVSGDELTLEYWPADASSRKEAAPFQASKISHIWRSLDLAERLDSKSEDETHEMTVPRAVVQVKRWNREATLGPLNEANRLRPGRPSGIRLGAVPEPTLFSSGSSYRLEVSEGTESIAVSLNLVDPEVDVDLYLRFASESELTDRTVLADYRSEGFTGNERIVISGDSTPSLRPGTYFVSLGIYTAGTDVEGTLIFTPRYTDHVCYIDLACKPEWDQRASSVAKILIEADEGVSGQCSGVLLSDRGDSGTPYFLTAAHCIDSAAEARSVEAYWYFQSAACGDEQNQDSRGSVTRGADLLAVESGSVGSGSRINPWGAGDMALLKLHESPPDGVVYMGWNATNEAIAKGTNVVGIHHSEQLHKKISFGRIADQYPNMTLVLWANGTSLGGASGSPLLNEEGQVLGVLSGGAGEDGCFASGRNVYSNFESFYPKIRDLLGGGVTPAVDGSSWTIDSVNVAAPQNEAPVAVALDSAGSLFVSGIGQTTGATGTVRKITAGGGATARGLDSGGRPGDLAPSPFGSSIVYVADGGNDVVWEWNTATGAMVRFAGGGEEETPRDDQQATDVQLKDPWGLAVDPAGILYVAEYGGGRVRKIDLTTGVITTGLTALNQPTGLAIDAKRSLYIADSGSDVVWRWDTVPQTIARVAGTGQTGYSGDGEAATDATLNDPWGLAVDAAGNLYVADSANHRVRRVDVLTGRITTIAGTGEAGVSGDGGSALTARLNTPRDVAVGLAGNAYVADSENYRVRRVSPGSTGPVTLGGRLVPGIPKRFDLDPQSARQIQYGDRSYSVEAPAGATRLTLVLESDDPSVDVDLYARFGQDNTDSAWHWRSVGPSGNEQIVIDGDSTPPLQEGTYYVSLLLYDNSGASASGSLEAILEPGSETSPGAGPVGINFVEIPAGEFTMGSQSDETDADETPLTRVRISQAFDLSTHEITQGQWEAVMGHNPSYQPLCGTDCPVEGVSWQDVQDFIERLNVAEDGYEYRLPTEAEWEYAARAGSTEDRHGPIDTIAWHSGNSMSTTHPVARKEANEFGLFDMLGNVWEWVQDWKGEYPGDSVTDPTGPDSGSERVVRGGGWSSATRYCRAPNRGSFNPSNRSNSIGFRLLRSVDN